MTLTALCHFAGAVITRVAAAGMRIISYRHRPGTGALMTRSARGDGRHEVIRRFRRHKMRRIGAIIIFAMTGFARFKGHDRMIHCRIGEGTARTLMAIVTIYFRATVHNRNVSTIRVIRHIHYIGIAIRVATRALATAGHSRMIEAGGRFKGGGAVARATVSNKVYIHFFLS